MKTINLQELTNRVTSLVREVGGFILGEYGKVGEAQISEKDHNMLVSYVDEEAEDRLIAQLGELVPNPSFLAEESESIDLKTDYRWIIDPLDGTTNFLHQIPCFAISVALEYKDQIILGVVYEITRDEMFFAWDGGGAYLNGRPIQVRQIKDLGESLIATGFPYHDYSRTEAYCQVLKQLMRQTRGIRRMGSAATDLAYVAAGRFDAFFEYSLSPWDVAAGSLIAREAGAIVCDFSGKNDYLFGEEIIAVNPAIKKVFLEIVQEGFG